MQYQTVLVFSIYFFHDWKNQNHCLKTYHYSSNFFLLQIYYYHLFIKHCFRFILLFLSLLTAINSPLENQFRLVVFSLQYLYLKMVQISFNLKRNLLLKKVFEFQGEIFLVIYLNIYPWVLMYLIIRCPIFIVLVEMFTV